MLAETSPPPTSSSRDGNICRNFQGEVCGFTFEFSNKKTKKRKNETTRESGRGPLCLPGPDRFCSAGTAGLKYFFLF